MSSLKLEVLISEISTADDSLMDTYTYLAPPLTTGMRDGEFDMPI